MDTEQRMIDRARLAEQIRPDIEELLKLEIQIKKLKDSIKGPLKELNARKKDLMKRVESLMVEFKYSKIRGDDGVITLVTRKVPVKMDAVLLAEKLTEILEDESRALNIATRVFENQELEEKKCVRVKPEFGDASEEELKLHDDV